MADLGDARAGAAFTVGHFLYATWAIRLLNEMSGKVEEKGNEKRPREAMKEWVGMNVLRTLTVDVMAWGCYLGAVL